MDKNDLKKIKALFVLFILNFIITVTLNPNNAAEFPYIKDIINFIRIDVSLLFIFLVSLLQTAFVILIADVLLEFVNDREVNTNLLYRKSVISGEGAGLAIIARSINMFVTVLLFAFLFYYNATEFDIQTENYTISEVK